MARGQQTDRLIDRALDKAPQDGGSSVGERCAVRAARSACSSLHRLDTRHSCVSAVVVTAASAPDPPESKGVKGVKQTGRLESIIDRALDKAPQETRKFSLRVDVEWMATPDAIGLPKLCVMPST